MAIPSTTSLWLPILAILFQNEGPMTSTKLIDEWLEDRRALSDATGTEITGPDLEAIDRSGMRTLRHHFHAAFQAMKRAGLVSLINQSKERGHGEWVITAAGKQWLGEPIRLGLTATCVACDYSQSKIVAVKAENVCNEALNYLHEVTESHLRHETGGWKVTWEPLD